MFLIILISMLLKATLDNYHNSKRLVIANRTAVCCYINGRIELPTVVRATMPSGSYAKLRLMTEKRKKENPELFHDYNDEDDITPIVALMIRRNKVDVIYKFIKVTFLSLKQIIRGGINYEDDIKKRS
jgi:hypothetical protein